MNIEEIRTTFISLISQVTREKSNIQGLIDYLDNVGFFSAPASIKYNNAFKGGLAQHSLNTYKTLKELMNKYYPEYDPDSLLIVGLLYDVSKSDCFVYEIKNKKSYREDGSKYDALGRYEWESYVGYNYNDAKNRLVFGNHEENSYLIISQFFQLNLEEAAAIVNHHGGVGEGTDLTNYDIPAIFVRYPLALFLHIADLISTYKEDINE